MPMPQQGMAQDPSGMAGGMGGGMAGGDPSGQDPEQLFEQGFEDLARRTISIRHPEVGAAVVLFKVLEASPEEGRGLGYGLLRYGGKDLMVPVVMVDNTIRLADMVYDPEHDVFVPLSPAWLDELTSSDGESLGHAADPPDFLFRDVDIRNLVIPPITGRFSYASEKTAAQHIATSPFLGVLKESPVPEKAAFMRLLKGNPEVRTAMLREYGAAALGVALHTPPTEKRALEVLTPASSPDEFRRVFGDEASRAYSKARMDGSVGKDNRKTPNRLVVEEGPCATEDANTSGAYEVLTREGKRMTVLVLRDPIDLFPTGLAESRYEGSALDSSMSPLDPTPSDYPPRPRPLVLFPNGDFLECTRVVGKPVPLGSLEAGALIDALRRIQPPRMGLGVFVRPMGAGVEATCPVKVTGTRSDTKNVRRVTATTPGGSQEKELYTLPKMGGAMYVHPGSILVKLPENYSFLVLKDRLPATTLMAETDYTPTERLLLGLAQPLEVTSRKSAFFLGGQGPFTGAEAARIVADQHYVRWGDARALIRTAQARGVATARALPEILLRLGRFKEAASAADPAKKPKAPEQDPSAQGGDPSQDPTMQGDPSQDPSAQGTPPDEAMMAQDPNMAPPASSPTDLAVLEALHELQQEEQLLATRQQTLQWVQRRVQELSGGAPPNPVAMSAMNGAPPPQPIGGAGAPQQPGMSGMGGSQDPSAMLGAISPQMMQGMQGQAGGEPGSQDPWAAMNSGMPQGGVPGGMDSQMMQHAALVSHLMSQMSPGLQGQLGGGGPGMGPGGQASPGSSVLDSAALTSFIDAPTFRSSVEKYVPDLVRGVDRLERVRLAIALKDREVREELGETTADKLQQTLDTTVERLSDAVLMMGHATASSYYAPSHERDAQ